MEMGGKQDLMEKQRVRRRRGKELLPLASEFTFITMLSINCFSHRAQIPDQNNLRNPLFASLFVHGGKDCMAPGTWNVWAHCVPSQAAGRNECSCSAPFSLCSCKAQPRTQCLPHSQWVISLHLNLPGNTLIDTPTGVFSSHSN